jgi:S1-C subfamily serine protease
VIILRVVTKKDQDKIMDLHLRCPVCGKALQVAEKLVGKVTPCPNCKKPIKIEASIERPCTVKPRQNQVHAPLHTADTISSPPPPPAVPPPVVSAPDTNRTLDKFFLILGAVTLLLIVGLIASAGGIAFIRSWKTHAREGNLARANPTPEQSNMKSHRMPDSADKSEPDSSETISPQRIKTIERERNDSQKSVKQQKKPRSDLSNNNTSDSANQKPANLDPTLTAGSSATVDLADLVEKVEPSVVHLNLSGTEGQVLGSGFVMNKRGIIITNYHVIRNATSGTVTFSDKTTTPIVGYSGIWPEKDIAIIQVRCSADKLHAIQLAMALPRTGDRVAAFGSPLGLSQSVSEGIVGAVREGKELSAIISTNLDATLIQTTTPISHGNSGGPLVNMKGEVVGVNTLTFEPIGGQNLNFAVSAIDVGTVLSKIGGGVLPLPVPGTPKEEIGASPQIVDLTGDPSAAALLKSAKKVRMLVTLSGTATVGDVEQLVLKSVESEFRGSSLELVKDVAPTVAVLVVDIKVRSADQQRGPSQSNLSFVIHAAMAQGQSLDDGTKRIVIFWKDTLEGRTSNNNLAREIERQAKNLARKLVQRHAFVN